MAKEGSFKGGDPSASAALNQMESDIEELQKQTKKLEKELAAMRSPYRFNGCENGLPVQWLINAQRVQPGEEVPEEEAP